MIQNVRFWLPLLHDDLKEHIIKFEFKMVRIEEKNLPIISLYLN